MAMRANFAMVWRRRAPISIAVATKGWGSAAAAAVSPLALVSGRSRGGAVMSRSSGDSAMPPIGSLGALVILTPLDSLDDQVGGHVHDEDEGEQDDADHEEDAVVVVAADG